MPNINIRGLIVPDDDLWIYDLFDMTATCPKTVRDALEAAGREPVTVNINSGGGDVFSGQEIYSLLREYPGNVLIRIQSIAASAAAVIAMARESEISPAAQIMIHNVSAMASGDYHEMDHTSRTLQTFNEALAAAFAEKTGKSRNEILDLMDRETWMTADRAVEEGFVDRIMEAPKTHESAQQLAASFGPGLLPKNVVDFVRKNHCKQTALEKAKAEYDYLNMEGK